MEHQDRAAIRRYWSAAAPTFDDEPDHGLADPTVRSAWRGRLSQWLPGDPARVVDMGCGTGSLSLLLAELGHDVLGVDSSPDMVALARAKAASSRVTAEFLVGDAEEAGLPEGEFDAVVCRHVLWTLLDPRRALERWARLLKPAGRLLLIEGVWFDPGEGSYSGATSSRLPWNGGVSAATLTGVLAPWFDQVEFFDLAASPELWGGPVEDERFAVVAVGPAHLRPDPQPAG